MNIDFEMVSRCLRGSLSFFSDKTIADGHADTLREMVLKEARHVDIDQIDRYVDLQFFAVYVEEETDGKAAYEEEQRIFRGAAELLAKRSEKLFIVEGQNDLAKIGQGRTAVVLAMENCASFDGDLSRIDAYYDAGYRSFGLTWNHPNCIGGGVAAPELPLSPFGREAVRKMGRLPVIIDMAHLGERSFYDTLELAEKPPFYSHGCCYGCFPHRRNLKDDQMKALADAGGIFGLTLCKHFLTNGEATISDFLDHLVYAAELIGVSSICLGSDFDGTDLPQGIKGPEDWGSIEEAMALRGFAPYEIAAIMGNNLVRFVSDALAVVGG